VSGRRNAQLRQARDIAPVLLGGGKIDRLALDVARLILPDVGLTSCVIATRL